jgi:uncharacterized protein YwqG/predicted DNA-binding WGR domain protein
VPRRFEFTEGTSHKFWEVSVDGKQLVVCFGRIGSAGQTKLKSFPDAVAAKLAMAKLIGEKTREGYVEADAAAPKPRSRKDELAALEAILAKTVQPYVRIDAKPRAKLAPWQSKSCDGRPYLPKSDPWPKAKSDRAMLPVLQIDFADVPALPGFPKQGLLSLWWTEDFQDRKLYYYPKILRDEAKLWTDFSRVSEGFLYPYMKPVALAFSKHSGTVCWGDFRFEQLVGGKNALHALHDSPHYNALFDHVWKRSGGADTRIGGWASPQQEDPRVIKKRAAYTTQLLQIQNDNFTHNLFVKPADLKRADFSDVLFFDACD